LATENKKTLETQRFYRFLLWVRVPSLAPNAKVPNLMIWDFFCSFFVHFHNTLNISQHLRQYFIDWEFIILFAKMQILIAILATDWQRDSSA